MATLRVHVVPNAKTDALAGEHGEAIKIRLRAQAMEGKANAALIRFLSKKLKLPQHAIMLQRGHTSREKVIHINGLSDEEVRTRLRAGA